MENVKKVIKEPNVTKMEGTPDEKMQRNYHY